MSELTYDDGWVAAKEDQAIGAGYAEPDETLPVRYRTGYIKAWFECQEDEDANAS